MNSVSRFFISFNAAVKGNLAEFVIPYSNYVYSILYILRQESTIFGFSVIENSNIKNIKVYLRFLGGKPVVKQLIQVYKPGRKVFASVFGLKMACSKFLHSHKISKQNKSSFFIVSTPFGMHTHYESFRINRGGSLVCFVAV
jgi:ribosomal protein S8